MSNGGGTIMFIGGVLAAAGVGYYLWKGGYFDSILDSINKVIDDIKGGGGGNGGTGCTGGKIKCKDGKCDTQSKCDSQAKCKSGEHWNADSKKCAKASNLALAYVTPVLNNARIRAYRLY
jgi:hypothetical protein